VTSPPGHSRRTVADVRATAARPGVARSATAGLSAVSRARGSRARGAAYPIGGARPRAIPIGPSAYRGAASSF